MKRRTVEDLILSHYNGNDNDFFCATLDVLKEFKEDAPEIYEHIVFELKGKIKIRPKREEPMYKSDMSISFEAAEKLGLTGPYLVPQEGSYIESLTKRLINDCPLPLHTPYPRSSRRAYIEGDEIVIEFYAFGDEKRIFESYRFKLTDQGKTWDFNNYKE